MPLRAGLVVTITLLAVTGCTDDRSVGGPMPPAPNEETSTPSLGGGVERVVEDGGRRETVADWTAASITPDGLHLAVMVEYGGCFDRFEGTQLTEETDAVRLVAIVSAQVGGKGVCSGAGLSQLVEVALAAPLGDRRLLGCRGDDPDVDCRDVDDPAFAWWSSPTAAGEGLVVVAEPDGVVARSATDSGFRWRHPVDATLGHLVILEGAVLAQTSDGALTSIDARTGRTRWTLPAGLVGPGGPVTPAGEVILTRDRGPLDTLHAIASASGEVRWTFSSPHATSLGDGLALIDEVVVVHERRDQVPGAPTLAVLDLATGAVRSRVEVPPGDLLDARGGAVVYHDSRGLLRVYDLDGTEVAAPVYVPGWATAAEHGIVLVAGDGQTSAVPVGAEEVQWSIPMAPLWPRAFTVHEDVVLHDDGPSTWHGLATDSGERVWTLDLFDQQPLARIDGAAPDLFLRSANTLLAVDATDGALAWWVRVPVPPPGWTAGT